MHERARQLIADGQDHVAWLDHGGVWEMRMSWPTSACPHWWRITVLWPARCLVDEPAGA
jgi:hypothetical protein